MNNPCNFDHNGECLICDCWPSDCAYKRYLAGDYSMESKEQLEGVFRKYINKTNNMQSIWKYPLLVADETKLPMPKGSIIISAVLQNTDICIYAIVDTEQPEMETVTIEVYGTGNPFPTDTKTRSFIGTVVAGSFVWHIFQKITG